MSTNLLATSLATDRGGDAVDQLSALEILRALDEHAIVAITDARGRILGVNDKFCAISKYGRNELVGQDHRIINSGLHPSAFFAELWTTISSGRVWQGEICNRAKDGELYWVATTIVPVGGKQAQPRCYIALRTDVTEQKRTEKRQRILEATLSHSRKLEAVGTLVNGVSHEFNNILGSLFGFLQLAQMEVAPDSPAQRFLEGAVSACRRARELVRRMHHFSREAEGPMHAVSLLRAVEEARALLRNRTPPGVAVDWVTPARCPEIRGNPNELREAIYAIVMNAVESITGQGVVQLTVRNEPPPAEVLLEQPRLTPRHTVTVTVTDSGPGIPAENLSRIFEPFFSTKPSGESRGLGLSTVYGIIKRHGGGCVVKSGPNGTIVSLYFEPLRTDVT